MFVELFSICLITWNLYCLSRDIVVLYVWCCPRVSSLAITLLQFSCICACTNYILIFQMVLFNFKLIEQYHICVLWILIILTNMLSDSPLMTFSLLFSQYAPYCFHVILFCAPLNLTTIFHMHMGGNLSSKASLLLSVYSYTTQRLPVMGWPSSFYPQNS